MSTVCRSEKILLHRICAVINNYMHRPKISTVEWGCVNGGRGEKEKRKSRGGDWGCLRGKKHSSMGKSAEVYRYTEALPVQLFKRL